MSTPFLVIDLMLPRGGRAGSIGVTLTLPGEEE